MSERAFAIQPEPTNIISLHREANGVIERRALQYDPMFDVLAYKQLFSEKPYLEKEEFQRKLDQLDQRTKNNLVTILGERFNLEISVVKYKMVDGKLVSGDHDEPMENVLIRGQQYRLRNGNPIDRERESAEVIGFQKRQAWLKAGKKTLVSISPKGAAGSDYKHHFFDMDENHSNGLTSMSRYTLRLTEEELLTAARKLNQDYPTLAPDEPFDAFFLKNPIATDLSRDQILQILHQNEKSMKTNEFAAKVEKPTRDLRNHYIKRLHEDVSLEEAKGNYKSILKIADLSTGLDTYTADNQKAFQAISQLISQRGEAAAIQQLSTEKLRSVPTNCGLQEETGASAYSVGEFGIFRDGFGTLEISCETCGANYLRTPGILEPRCRFCSGTAGIACQPSQEDSSQELAKAA